MAVIDHCIITASFLIMVDMGCPEDQGTSPPRRMSPTDWDNMECTPNKRVKNVL